VETIPHTYARADTRGSDPLLAPNLAGEGDKQAREALERVVDDHAGPVILGIIRSRLSGFRNVGAGPDVEDVYNDAAAQLIARLDGLRAGANPSQTSPPTRRPSRTTPSTRTSDGNSPAAGS
jgi:hypothetical protein